MANRHTGNDDGTDRRTNDSSRKEAATPGKPSPTDKADVGRRSFMKLAGAGAAVAATGAVGSVSALELDTDRVVNLGDEGLSPGDTIDPYLDEYFVDGTEVRVPAGEYDWKGRGFHRGATRDAAVIGEGEVILNAVDDQYRNTIVAESGTLAIKNFTVRGIVEHSRNRFEARPGARIVVDNWNFPDGSEPASRSRAFYTPQEHAGEVVFRNCYVHNMSNNGFYVTSQGKGEGGRVVIDNCVSHNNNIAGFRIGGHDSVIRNSLVLNDGPAPENSNGHLNMRGIRLDYGDESDDLTIENTDIVHTYDGSGANGPIRWSSAGASGSGHIENVRIHNNTSVAAIADRRSRAEDWTGNNISVVGDGDLDVPDWFTDVRNGDEATAPSTDTSTDPDGSTDRGSDTDDSTDDDSDAGTDDDTGTDPVELVLITTDSDGIEYTFTATDTITPLYSRSEYRANRSEPTDYAEENDDGTWTAYGSTAGGEAESGDSFHFEGELTEFVATGDVDALTIQADGEQLTEEELLATYGSDDSDAADDEDEPVDDESDADEPADDDTDSDENEPPSGADGELPNRIIVDGTGAPTVASYKLEVTGDIRPDESISSEGASRWDAMDDVVEEGSVVGVVGRGIDGFRYSGELVAVSVDGVVDITIESSDL